MSVNGNRELQRLLGGWLVVVGSAILLTPIAFLEQMPSGAFAWIGGLALLGGAWLVSPIGVGGFLESGADAWQDARENDSS